MTLTTAGNLSIFVQIEAIATSDDECRFAVIDITSRRRAEDALSVTRQELEELNISLEQRVTRAVDELRRNDQKLLLQDRLAVMGEMINSIAHQWRQPLNTLGLVIQKLLLFYDSADFNRNFLEENAAHAMKLIQLMSHNIEDFRRFFSSDMEAETFGVNRVIEQTISLIKKSFREQHITIDFKAQGDPMISGYPYEFAQVILNILMNTRDALAGNDSDNAIICVKSFSEKGKAVVTITDKAGGIDSEIVSRLFESYFAISDPDKKGPGIGLYMSRTIIETNFGGGLTVCNTGEGAEFRIEVENAEN